MSIEKHIISLKGVTKDFDTKGGKLRALNSIDLDIDEGDIYGIIGLSGAGKSTLVRCMNLLEKPTEGKVIFDGKSLTSLSQRDLNTQRRKIAMIFQQFNLLMQRTSMGNIGFPLEIAKISKKDVQKRAKELLKIVDLEDKADAYPSQLSGGQKQRVAIARALATNPKVLLCDEATSALDPKTTKSILALIKQINAEFGITIVIITHEMSVIQQICNKVAIIENGEIAESGTVEDIFTRPKTSAARRLVLPDEEDTEDLTGEDTKNFVRLVFDNVSAYEPKISNMILESGEPVNVMYANIQNVEGKNKGQMILQLSDKPGKAKQQKQYLIDNNISFIDMDKEV